ncbi:MAG: radical SAM protein [Candidatus Geothermarchaeales archaeon]
MFQTSRKLEDLCRSCGFCEREVSCPGIEDCIGCGACVDACPYRARLFESVYEKRKSVRVTVNGETFEVPQRITVLRALELLGFKVSRYPGGGDVFAPCRTGGCWSCAVIIDGSLKPSCVTPVRDGVKIETHEAAVSRQPPLRLVSGFQGHFVGGVGTPYWIKPRGRMGRYVEVACFAHGCILRCPTCQNWRVTYSSRLKPLSPVQTSKLMTLARREYGVDRMAISGGECTLNRRWLVNYVRELKALNADERARIHVDTNAVILRPDYVEELIEAGVTDIGPDIKGLKLDTFLRITGLDDRGLAERLLDTMWGAVKYLLDHHWGEIFIGVGIPYNPGLISMEEIYLTGERIAGWEPRVQVCVLDYRPEFRRRDIRRPSYDEMIGVKRTLEDAGLKCVICQTEYGHVGPGEA